MGLGAGLNTAVSGLNAQGSRLSSISDNIANLNTTGYKRTETRFKTLVTNNNATQEYSPGGVLTVQKQLIDEQGILEATNSATDIAIAGSGLMVANASPDATGEVLYTRAGSFTPDNLGNFKNPAGYFLMGWPLDADGRLPGDAGNINTTSSAELDSLEVINISASSGTATATTGVEIGANLDASQLVYNGAGRTIDFVSAENADIAEDDVIIPVAGALDDTVPDTFTVSTSGGLVYTFEYGGVSTTNQVAPATPMFSAVTGTQPFFLAGAGPSGADADFTLTTSSVGTITFTYRQSAPNAFQQQFNSLSTLATAINEVNGLTARVYNDTLYIAPDNANEVMTFADGGATGWVAGIGLNDTAAPGVNPRFASLKDLASKINDSDGISAQTNSPLSATTLVVRTEDPLGTITFDDIYGTPGYNMLAEMSVYDGVTDPVTYGPVYDPDNATTGASNMASGDITPQFSRNVRVYDSLGSGHNFTIGFLKLSTNTWSAEVWASDENDVNSVLSDDLVARGTIQFNGDGSLLSVSEDLLNPVTIEWKNGALASSVTFDWGTFGQPFGTAGATEFGDTNGLSQFDADYNVRFVNQNGAPVGELTGVIIDEDGFVIANYTNGESARIYQLPLAQFSNYNGLQAITGNVFRGTEVAGEVNLRVAGSNGVGGFNGGALESSNVELAKELTTMIVAQRGFQANARVITTTDQLLEELTQLGR